MLQQALEYLANLGHTAASPNIHFFSQFPDQAVITRPNGTVEFRECPRPHLAHKVDLIRDLVALISLSEETSGDWRFWIGERAIIMTLDETLRERATMALDFTEQFESLCRCAGKLYDHAGFIRLLTVDLHGTVDAAAVSVLRNVKVSVLNETEGDVQKTANSLGKRVASRISGAGDIPEIMTVETPVYDQDATSTFTIRCALLVDPMAATFQIRPLPGEIRLAKEQARFLFREQLRNQIPGCEPENDLDQRILFGSPE